MSREHYRQLERAIKDARAQAKSNDGPGAVYAVAFVPDGTRVFDAATGQELARLDHGC